MGSQFHHRPRFHRPPYDPGRSDFPSPVLTSALHAIFQMQAFPCESKLKRRLAYTPNQHGLPAPCSKTNSSCRLVGAFIISPLPHRFLRNRRVPRAPLPVVGVTHIQDVLIGHLRRHYSSFIALTGSCVRPNPSHRLGLSPWALGPCRLSPVPAGGWPFPTLSLQSL